MKKLLRWTTGLGLAILLGSGISGLWNAAAIAPESMDEEGSKELRMAGAIEHEFERTKDLALGYPPTERLVQAISETRALQEELAFTKGKFDKVRFRERGPNNVGGRTRTIMLDSGDPSRKTLWAGGDSGGLWRTRDVTANPPKWEKVNDHLESLAIGGIAQDPNNPNLMYLGTGSPYGNTNRGGKVGAGLFRSTDGGDNWELLPNTGQLQFTRDMAVHPNGDVYAGTTVGVYRSQDQGDTWVKVFGTLLGGLDNIFDLFYMPTNDYLYVSTVNSVHRSKTGNPNEWENLSTGIRRRFPSGLQRTELTVSKTDPDIMYVIGNSGGTASAVYRTINGGDFWQNMGPVAGIPDIANGQAWHDLEIEVDPFNPQHVIVGGVPLFHSFDGGFTWQQATNNMHVDQMEYLFDDQNAGVIYYSTDGGVWRSGRGSAGMKEDKNFGYNTSQFYSGALHPEAYSDYMLGGTQDNSSLQLNSPGVGSSVVVLGGDGMLCHIDQDEGENQLVSLQFGNYALSRDGGRTFSGGAAVNGAFVNPSDYDDDANILYTETNDGDFYRWRVTEGMPELVDIEDVDFSNSISVVIVDENVPNRVYFGTFAQGIYRVDDADEGELVQAKRLLLPLTGAISCVASDPQDSNHLLATLSNYGLSNNIFESFDNGETWKGVEGNLPDIPVRWVLFAPEGGSEAIIATDAGVWFTEQLNGNATEWIPPVLDQGTPLVSVHMLQMRKSDNLILAATHGRGLFTSDFYTPPKAIVAVDRVGYLDAPIEFRGDLSFGGKSFAWDFGDGTTDSLENTVHEYSKIGEYDIALTLNDSLTERTTIKILPDKAVPYTEETETYSGSFENNPQDYGVHTLSGSAFERGKTDFRGKSGTNSGENAFVLGVNEEFYQPNTHSILYLPKFDLTEEGIYEFSFWSKYNVHQGFDGFQAEYSTDKGANWRVLGNSDNDNWYDFRNTTAEEAAFPIGSSYFTRSTNGWEQFYIDVSFLSGNEAAFRFVFRADGIGNHPGVAIDDVEITKYERKLETAIVNAEAEYLNLERAIIRWTTQPEYQAQEFQIERSFNGRDYELVETVDALGKTTSRIQNYEVEVDGIRNLYFYRIRSINEHRGKDYFYEFATNPLVLRRNFEDVEVFRYAPNPITNFIDLTFTDLVTEELHVELFDNSGKLLYEATKLLSDTYTRVEFPHLNLPKGVYLLRYQIGDRDTKTIKLIAAP